MANPAGSPWRQLFGMQPPYNNGMANGLPGGPQQIRTTPMFRTPVNGQFVPSSSSMQHCFPSHQFPLLEPYSNDMVMNQTTFIPQQFMQQQPVYASNAHCLSFLNNQPVGFQNQLFPNMQTFESHLSTNNQQMQPDAVGNDTVTYLTPSLQSSAAKEADITKKIDDRANKLIRLMERMQTSRNSENGENDGTESDDAVFYRKHYVDAAKSVRASSSTSDTTRGPPVSDARQLIASKKREKNKKTTLPATASDARSRSRPSKLQISSNVDEATGRKKRSLARTNIEATPPPPPMEPPRENREREKQLDADVVSSELLRKSWGRGMEPSRLLMHLPTDAEEQQLREHLERRIAAVYDTNGIDTVDSASISSPTDVLDMRQYVGGRSKTYLTAVPGKAGGVVSKSAAARAATAAATASEPDGPVNYNNVFSPDAELEILYESSQSKSKKPKVMRLGSAMPFNAANFAVSQRQGSNVSSLTSFKAQSEPKKSGVVQQKASLPLTNAPGQKTNNLQAQRSIDRDSRSQIQNTTPSKSGAAAISSVRASSSAVVSSLTPPLPSQLGVTPVVTSSAMAEPLQQTSFASLLAAGKDAGSGGGADDDADEYSPTLGSPASCAAGEKESDKKPASPSASLSSVVELDDDDQATNVSSFAPEDDETHPHNIVYPPAFDYTSWREIAHNIDIKLVGMSLESAVGGAKRGSKSIVQTEQNLANSKTEMHDARQALLAHRLLYESIDKVIQVRQNECVLEECKLQAMEGRVRKMEQDLSAEKVRLEAQRKSLALPRGLLSFAERERELAEKRENMLLQRMQAAQQRYTVLANELRDVRKEQEDAEAAMAENVELMLSSCSAAEPPAVPGSSFGTNSVLSLSSLAAVSSKPRSRAMFFDSIEQVNLQRKALLIGRMLRPGDEELVDKSVVGGGTVRQFIPDSEPMNPLSLENIKTNDAAIVPTAFTAESGADFMQRLDSRLGLGELSKEIALQEGGDAALNNDYWQSFKWYRFERCLNQLVANPVTTGSNDDMLLMVLYADVNRTAESVWSIESAGAVLFDTNWLGSLREKALSAELQLSSSRSAAAAGEATALPSSSWSVSLMVHLEQLLIFDLLLYSLVHTLCANSSSPADDAGSWPFFTTDYTHDAVLIDKLFDEKLDEVRRLCADELDVVAKLLPCFRRPNVAADADTRNELAIVRGMRHAIAKFTHLGTTAVKNSRNALWWHLYEFERPMKKRTKLFHLMKSCRRILLLEKSILTGKQQKKHPVLMRRRPAGKNLSMLTNVPVDSRAAELMLSVKSSSSEVCDVCITSSAVNFPSIAAGEIHADDAHLQPIKTSSLAVDAEVVILMEDMLARLETDCSVMWIPQPPSQAFI